MKNPKLYDLLERAIHMGWMLVLLLIPVSMWWNSAAIIFTGALSVIKVVLQGDQGGKLNWRNPQLLPVLVFLAYGLSLCYCSELLWGAELLFRQNAYLLFPIIMLINRTKFTTHFDTYIKAYFIGLIVTSVSTLVLNYLPQEMLEQITQSSSLLTDYIERRQRFGFGGYSPFVDRLRFSYLLGAGILLLIWQMCRDGMRFSNVSMAVLFFLVMLILGARGAQLAIIASLVVWLFYFIFSKGLPILQTKVGKWQAYTIGVVLFGCISIGGPIILSKTVPSVKVRYKQLAWEMNKYQSGKMLTSDKYDYKSFTTVRRIQSWKNTWSIIKRQPILGVGIGDWERVLNKQYLDDEYGFPPNSHQQFLHHWMIAGILGLLALILMLTGFLLAMWRSGNANNRLLGLTFILFFVITFLFDIPLWYQTSRVGFLALFGMILLLTIPSKSYENKEVQTAKS